MASINIKEMVEKFGREATVDALVNQLNMTRDYAEFLVAMELGETTGDLVQLDDEEDNAATA